jgi:tRNA G18 (ribose-2'-O)-methylase SpoU
VQKLSPDQLQRIRIKDFKPNRKLPLIVILDNVRSMNNVGSVFRTCDAFGIRSIYLCGITASPPHREIEKTALGATRSVNWQYFSSTQEAVLSLTNQHYRILAVEQAQESIPLQAFQWKEKQNTALVFGNEIFGVQQEIVDLCQGCIEIPQYGTKHSLKISDSAGIVLWQMSCLFQGEAD